MLARALIAVAIAGCYERIPNRAALGDARDAGNGSSDAPRDVATACWTGVTPPTNFRPCDSDFPPAGAQLQITTAQTWDTTSGTLGAGPAPGGPYTPDSRQSLWLAHLAALDVRAPLTIVGGRPLLIICDGPITISDKIDANGTSSAACDAAAGNSGTLVGGGGGGGGNGAGGAGGGSGLEQGGYVAGGIGGTPSTSTALPPLLAGCPGGPGGMANGHAPGASGQGGGALELVSVSAIQIRNTTSPGQLAANGAGGGQGLSATLCSTTNACSGGGGGGGAGGMILLEAPSIVFETGTTACAAGGGGGQGGDPQADVQCAAGTAGDCSAGTGGHDVLCAGGFGGNGTNDPQTPAGAGGATNSINMSGGGGGGGPGRIYLHDGKAGAGTTNQGTILPSPVSY